MAVKVQIAEQPKQERKIVRSSRGRQPDALKGVLEEIPKKRYRTRKDYTGDRWQESLEQSKPSMVRVRKSLETQPETTKRVAAKSSTKKVPEVLHNSEVKESLPMSVDISLQGKDVEGGVSEVVKMVKNSIPSEQDVNIVPAELAYSLVDLCSKYMFLMKGAFEKMDAVAEIDIHIKVKPSSNFKGGSING